MCWLSSASSTSAGGGVAVDLSIKDGATDMWLLKGKTVAANDAIEIWDEALLAQQELWASAASPNSIWLHVSTGLKGMR